MCKAISDRDPTFRFVLREMRPKYRDKYENMVVVFSDSLDQAHRRGTIITKRYLEDLKLMYWVRGEAHGTKNHQDQLR